MGLKVPFFPFSSFNPHILRGHRLLCTSLVSVGVIKYPDKKQFNSERGYVSSQLLAVVHQSTDI